MLLNHLLYIRLNLQFIVICKLLLFGTSNINFFFCFQVLGLVLRLGLGLAVQSAVRLAPEASHTAPYG